MFTMHLYLSFITAWVFVTQLAAERTCKCDFPNEMSGWFSMYLNIKSPFIDLLYPTDLLFEVNFNMGLARLYPYDDPNGWKDSEYIQDFNNSIMYRFPYGNKGPCTYVNMTEGMKIPSCLPDNWVKEPQEGADYYYPTEGDEDVPVYGMRPGKGCRIFETEDEQLLNSTTYVSVYMTVKRYVLLSDGLKLPNTTGCLPADIDSLYRDRYRTYNEE